MSDDDDKPSDLASLRERIERARGQALPEAAARTTVGASAGDGLRVAIEFVVSVLVGSGLGFTIGSFFGAPVIGLVIGMPFGFAAGLRTVYRGMMAGTADAPDKEKAE